MTEAAAAAAIAAILVLLKLVMPFLVAVTMMASAVPIAVIAGLHGMRWGIGTAVAEILLVNMIGGPEIGLTTAFYAAALGLALGYSFIHGLSFVKSVHVVALAFLVEMTYKVTFSIYILGIADALAASIERLASVIRWIWQPLARLFSMDPSPEKSAYTTGGMVFFAILFIIEAYIYAYWNVEIGRNILKRLKAGMREN